MGADIHSFAEVRKNGKWLRVEEPLFEDYGDKKTTEPFGWRSYAMFSFLADVRNDGHCTPICDPKGLPDDSEWLNTPLGEPQRYVYYGHDNGTATTRKGEVECDINYHSCSWLTLKELLGFDYDQKLFLSDASIGEEWKATTYKERLGEWFFRDMGVLGTLGAPENVRVVFWFDN
jgi:hypothetical protein